MFHQRGVGAVVTTERSEVEAKRLALETDGEAGQAGVDRVAHRVDDSRLRQRHADQAHIAEVRRHLVGDPADLAPRRPGVGEPAPGHEAQPIEVRTGDTGEVGLGESGNVVRKARASRNPALGVAERLDLPRCEDQGVRGQDLLDERRSRPRHAHDEHRRRPRVGRLACAADQFRGEDVLDAMEQFDAVRLVHSQPFAMQRIAADQMLETARLLSHVGQRLAEGEMQHAFLLDR